MVTDEGESHVKLYRIGLAAGLLAGAVALTACSSSSSGGGDTSSASSTPAAASSASSSASSTTASTSASSGGSTGTVACAKGSLKSDGSTAQQNAITALIKAYSAKCPGATIVYSGGGSGQGVTDFTGGKVDFAGSDAALDPAKGEPAAAAKACATGGKAIDIPMITGPVALAFKLNGVSDLTLTPAVTAQIFTGKIKTWNDPAIVKLNPTAKLPSSNITVFFRSDSSGTTQNFETYLNTAAPADYTAKPSKTWAGVGQGKTGSQGVQTAVAGTEGSIGYLEWSFAGSGGLSMAKIDNGGGPVALTAETAGAAVSAAKVIGTGGDLSLKLDYATKAPGAYPLILVTYEIACTKYKDATQGALVKSFLSYAASAAGQGSLTAVGSAPLPSAVLTQVQTAVAGIS
jgi:phosphate transport system substrate-binding protein